MKIVAIVSAKGGVGKTTVTANLATALAHAGRAVLTVDLDPQNALRLHFGLDPHGVGGSSRATLAGSDWRAECVVSRGGIVVLPYGLVNEDDRRRFEQRLDAEPRWLADQLESLELHHDAIVLLDTPPGPSVYLRHALTLADIAVNVTLADAASYATLPMTENLVHSYCAGRPGFGGHFHLINQTDGSRQLAVDVVEVMRQRFGDRVLATVHRDQAVGEALAYDSSALDYAPDSQAAADFRAAAAAVLRRLDRHPEGSR
ncbi:cellulose biosynthesis protein BcsQ [uncultured Xylophilus sp.]|uniref:cellulose biosynthesis protein BcsQ n=1 Tax=uncultured Xylophilus sp. TaxID=296832 RepID=UPI0025DE5331|nr:cellulose biosynthesis protein BcsQ [uncultured Xylophilus sp.]